MNRSWSPAENVWTTVHSSVAMAPSMQRQAGLAGVPGGPAERLAPGVDRSTGEAVRERLLVLRRMLTAYRPAAPDDRGQEPAAVERDHDQRRVERDGAQGVDRDPERADAVERGHDRHAGDEMAQNPPKMSESMRRPPKRDSPRSLGGRRAPAMRPTIGP